LLRRRRSVIDLVRSEAQSIRARAGTVDQARLDLHLESIRQLENKLIQSGVSAGACRELAGADRPRPPRTRVSPTTSPTSTSSSTRSPAT